MLTDHERRLLTEIELQLGLTDPRLAARLTGARRDRLRFRFRAVRTPVSAVGGITGAALVVTFFATIPIVAILGLALLGLALHANLPLIGAAVQRRVASAVRWLRGEPADEPRTTG